MCARRSSKRAANARVTTLGIGNPQCVARSSPCRTERGSSGWVPPLPRIPVFRTAPTSSSSCVEVSEHVRILSGNVAWDPRGVGDRRVCGGHGRDRVRRCTARPRRDIARRHSAGGVDRRRESYLTGWAEIVFDGTWIARSARLRPQAVAGSCTHGGVRRRANLARAGPPASAAAAAPLAASSSWQLSAAASAAQYCASAAVADKIAGLEPRPGSRQERPRRCRRPARRAA